MLFRSGSGFVISVPIALGSRLGYGGMTVFETFRESLLSVLYRLILFVPFFALVPFARIDWKATRVPQFQLFELSVTRTATFVAGILTLLSLQARVVSDFAEPRLSWTVFVLMGFAWGRIRLWTIIFPEFYRNEPA